jgi:hypothetical protein
LALSKESVARELLPLAASNIGDYLERDELGRPVMEFDLTCCTEAQLKAIKSLKSE